MGARPLEINFKELDALLQFKPSLKFCAEYMRCSEDTIEKRIREEHDCTFSEYRETKMQYVSIKLRQKAISMALAGNVPMLIFSLKNVAGWTDKVDIANEETISIVINERDKNL